MIKNSKDVVVLPLPAAPGCAKKLGHPRDTAPRVLSIPQVVVAEKAEQQALFERDAPRKEVPDLGGKTGGVG